MLLNLSYLGILIVVLHFLIVQNVDYLIVRWHYFIRKMKMQHEEKLWKMLENVVLQHKTYQVMFYRQQRSWWYNFEHFLSTQINDDKFGPFVTE